MSDDAIRNSTTPAWLDTEAASAYLQEIHGIKRTPATLCKLRTIGSGPRFHKAGAAVQYTPVVLDEWAAKLRGPAVRSTAEYQAA